MGYENRIAVNFEMTRLSDEQLCKLSPTNDEAAEIFAARYRGRAERYLDSRFGYRVDYASIVNIAIAKTIRRVVTGKVRGIEAPPLQSIRRYLYSVAWHEALREQAAYGPNRADFSDADDVPEDLDREDQILAIEQVSEVMGGLTPDARQLLIEHYFQNLTISEMAALHSKSPSTIAKRLAEVRKTALTILNSNR